MRTSQLTPEDIRRNQIEAEAKTALSNINALLPIFFKQVEAPNTLAQHLRGHRGEIEYLADRIYHAVQAGVCDWDELGISEIKLECLLTTIRQVSRELPSQHKL